MSQLSEHCPTVLIEDEPSDIDAFSTPEDIGPHARIALAIEQTIYSSSGGKVIGLEGGWGAGKSTVVRLLTRKLARDVNFAVVPFDAWAHEGDPLRRTYLENLVGNLQRFNWLEKKEWDKRLSALAKRTKTTHTKTTRTPTLLGLCLAVSLLALPVGSALLTGALRDYGITFSRTELGFAWQFAIGILLCLGPLLVGLLRLVYLFVSGNVAKILDPTSWSFLSGKYDEDISTDSSEAPNPTSIEFELFFAEAMTAALSHPERRILLVIDNLDRTDASDALKIWATMQTFLIGARGQENDWFRRLWVLVPYDREGLRKLWDQNHRPRESVPLTVDMTPAAPRPVTTQGEVSESFFEKSFQVRFHVPPLVSSGWRTLLHQLVEKGLPNHKVDQRSIFRVLDHFRADRIAPPTPRQLKAFVNQLGAIHRQWGHSYPLDHVAYFVLKSAGTREFIASLRTGQLPSEDAVRMLGPELRKNLAGLAFNVPPDRGMELLLSGLVLDTLTQQDDPELDLASLAGRHGAGFWQTLEQVVFERVDELTPIVLARLICRCEASKLLELDRPEAPTVIRAIRNATERVDDWTPLDEQIGAGVASAIILINDAKFTSRVIKAIEKTLDLLRANAEAAVGVGARYAGAVIRILVAADSRGHSGTIPARLVLPVSAPEWDGASLLLSEVDPQRLFWHLFAPSCGHDAVINFVVTSIGGGQFSERTARTMEVTGHIYPDITWAETLSSFRQRLDAGLNIGSDEAFFLMESYRLIKKEGKAQERPFRDLFENGHILHHYYRAVQDGNMRSRALFAYLHLNRYPAHQRVSVSGNTEAGFQSLEGSLNSAEPEFAASLLEVMEREKDSSLIFRVIENRGKVDSLMIACLQQAAERPLSHMIFSSQVVRQKWQMLKANLDQPHSKLFAKVLRAALDKTSLAQDLLESEGGFNISDIAFYSEIIAIDGSPAASKLALWCSERLSNISTPEWNSDFGQPFALAGFSLLLARRGVPPRFSLEFLDAIESHARQVSNGQQIPPDALAANWGQLVLLIGEESLRSNLRLQLLRVAAEHGDGRLHGAFFDIYGGFIDDVSSPLTNLEPLLRLTISMVKHGMPPKGLRWASHALRQLDGAIYDATTESLRKELELRVRNALQEVPAEEMQPEVLAVATALGVVKN